MKYTHAKHCYLYKHIERFPSGKRLATLKIVREQQNVTEQHAVNNIKWRMASTVKAELL